MENIIIRIIPLIAAVIFHEAGHYFIMKLYINKNPAVKFRWKILAVTVGEKQYLHLTNKQYFNVLIGGIFTGLPFVLYDRLLFWFYIGMSSVDILNIILNYKGWMYKPTQKVIDFDLYYLNEWKRKLKQYYREADV